MGTLWAHRGALDVAPEEKLRAVDSPEKPPASRTALRFGEPFDIRAFPGWFVRRAILQHNGLSSGAKVYLVQLLD